ncbi:uncharacterized protein LOC120340463 isoform X1 [Styela clava]
MPSVQDPSSTPPPRPPPPGCRPTPSTRPQSAGSRPVPARRTHSASPTHDYRRRSPTASASLHLSSESIRGARAHLQASQSRGGETRHQRRPSEPLRGTREPVIQHRRRQSGGQPRRTPRQHREGERRRSSAADQRRNGNGQAPRSRRSRPEITIVAARPMADHPAFADGDKGGYIPPEAPPSYEQAMRTPLPLNPTFTDPAVPDHISEVRRVFPRTQIINSDVITVPSYSSSVTSQTIQHTPTVTSSLSTFYVTSPSITSSHSEPVFSVTSSNSIVTSQRASSSANVTSQNPVPRQRNTNHSNNILSPSTRIKTISSSRVDQTHQSPNAPRLTLATPSASRVGNNTTNSPPALPAKKPVLKPKPRTTTKQSDNSNSATQGPQTATETPKPHARRNLLAITVFESDLKVTDNPTSQNKTMSARSSVPTSHPNSNVMSLFDNPSAPGPSPNLLTPMAPSGGSQMRSQTQSNNTSAFDSMMQGNPQGGAMNPGMGAMQTPPQMRPMGPAPMRPNLPPGNVPIGPQMGVINNMPAPVQNYPTKSSTSSVPLQSNQPQGGVILRPNQISTPIQPHGGVMKSFPPPSNMSSPLSPMASNATTGARVPDPAASNDKYAAFGDLFGAVSSTPKPAGGNPPPQSAPTFSGAQSNYAGLGDLFGGAQTMGNTPPQVAPVPDNSNVFQSAGLLPPPTATNSLSPSSGYTQQGHQNLNMPPQQGFHSSATAVANSMATSKGNMQQGLLSPQISGNSPAAPSVQPGLLAHHNAGSLPPSSGNAHIGLLAPSLGTGMPQTSPGLMQPVVSQQLPPQVGPSSSGAPPSGPSPGSRKLPPPPRPTVGPQRKPGVPKTSPPTHNAPTSPPLGGIMSPTNTPQVNQSQVGITSTKSAYTGGLIFNPDANSFPISPSGGANASNSAPQGVDLFSMDVSNTSSFPKNLPNETGVQNLTPSDPFAMDNQSVPMSGGLLAPTATPPTRKMPNIGDSPNPVIEPVYAAVTNKKTVHYKLGEEKTSSEKVGVALPSGPSSLLMENINGTPQPATASTMAPTSGTTLLDMMEPSKNQLMAAEIGDAPPPLPMTRPPLEDFEDLLSPSEMSKAMADREKSQKMGILTQNSNSSTDDGNFEDIFGFGSPQPNKNQGTDAAVIEPVYESGGFKDKGLPHVVQSSAPPVLPAPRTKKNIHRTPSVDIAPSGAPALPKNPPKMPDGSAVVFSATDRGKDAPHSEATVVNLRKKNEEEKSLKKKFRRTSMRIKQQTMSLFKKNETEQIKSPPPDGDKIHGENPKKPSVEKPKPPRPAGPPPPRPSELPAKAGASAQQSSLISPVDNTQPALMIAQSSSQFSQSSLLMDIPIIEQPLTPAAQSASLIGDSSLIAQSSSVVVQSDNNISQPSTVIAQSKSSEPDITNSPIPVARKPQQKPKPAKPPPPKIIPTRPAPARPPPRNNTNHNNHHPSPVHKNVNLLDAPTPKPRSNSKTDPPLLEKQPTIAPTQAAPSKPNVKPSRPPPSLPIQKKAKPAAAARSAPKPAITQPKKSPGGNTPQVGSKVKDLKFSPEVDHYDEIDAAPQNSGLSATAVYDFNGAADDELVFKAGDKITMVTIVNDDWYKGSCDGKSGIFPCSFVTLETNRAEQNISPLGGSRSQSEGTPPNISQSGAIDISSLPTWDDVPTLDDLTLAEPKIDAEMLGKSPPKPPRVEKHSDTSSSDTFFDVSDQFLDKTVPTETVAIDNNEVTTASSTTPPITDNTDITTSDVTSSPVTAATGMVRRSSTAIFSFTGRDGSELSFEEGDIITITGEVNEEWFVGESNGNTGMFPSAFVQEHDHQPATTNAEISEDLGQVGNTDSGFTNSLPEPVGGSTSASSGGGGFVEPMATAIKDYTATSSEEISFKTDDVLYLLEVVDSDWLMVQHDQSGAVGNVPKSHVKIIQPLP